MDRLDKLQNKLLKRLQKIDNKSFQRYKKISNNLQVTKSKFSSKLNKIEENIVIESEDKDTDLLLQKIQ